MNEVVKLRRAKYFNNFRKKMVELKKIIGEESLEDAINIIEDIKVKEMEELIEIVRPNPKKTVIKAFSSMIPLPLPVNPLDLIFSGEEIL